jgi:hypothetical protein
MLIQAEVAAAVVLHLVGLEQAALAVLALLSLDIRWHKWHITHLLEMEW